jgi:16S rRNA (guanine(966)-N(2))-methyltransferase RsmD
VRIISGTHKGRRIPSSSKFTARPTTDFAKENLFNVLNNLIDFEDIYVLDLFAGTGGISYEFASRGASMVISVEKNHKHFAYIKSNCDELNFSNIKVIKADALKFVKMSKEKFDMIFADPPYDMPKVDEVVDKVLSKDLLNDDGMFIFEHSERLNFSDHPMFIQTRKYGSVNFSFFQKKND